jgi:hypothetical protein
MKAKYEVRLACMLAIVAGLNTAAAAEAQPAAAEASKEPALTVAVLGFEPGKGLPEDMGKNVSSMLSAYLSTETDARMVEREQVDKALGEVGLGLSGMVSTEDAVKVGKLIGAKVLVTGRVFSLTKDDLTLTVKVIGAETGRSFGLVAKSKGPQDLDAAVKSLATQVAETMKTNGKLLVAAPTQKKDPGQAIAEAVAKMEKPTVLVAIDELHRSPLVIIDPAAETEMSLYLTQAGFKVVDRDAKLKNSWAAQLREYDPQAGLPAAIGKDVQVVITGQAVSELAFKKGDLFSCKARVEVKAIDVATGAVLAIDRETGAGVDVTESTAAKTAIQQATEVLAVRVIPRFTEAWNAAKAKKEAK